MWNVELETTRPKIHYLEEHEDLQHHLDSTFAMYIAGKWEKHVLFSSYFGFSGDIDS